MAHYLDSILARREMVWKKVGGNKTRVPEPIPAGRQGGGLKPEDVEYLVNLFKGREEKGDLNPGTGMAQLTELNTLTLAQLAGLPARKYHESLLNDKVAARIQKMFNEYQEKWHFVFEGHQRGGGPFATSFMGFKVEDAEYIGGQEFADMLDI